MIAVVGINLVDVEHGVVIENQTIIIESERIIDVVTTNEFNPTPQTHVIDGEGLFAIPGLWDMHIHNVNDFYDLVPWDLYVPDATEPDQREVYIPLYVAFGITGVREMSGGLKTIELRDRIERGELRGPRLIVGSPLLEGEFPIWPDGAVIAIKGPDEARDVVNQLHDQGFDFLKAYSFLSADSYRALFERANELGMDVAGDLPVGVSLWEASKMGLRSVEHLTGVEFASSSREEELRASYVARIEAIDANSLEEDRVAIWNQSEWEPFESLDLQKQARLFEYLAEHETWVVPTLIVQRMISFSDDPEIAENPLNRYLDPWSRDPTGVTDEFDPERRLRPLHRHRLAIVDDLHRAGVGILAGSDTPGGFTLHQELQLFVDAGLTPLDALRTATVNPARFLGLEDERGSIAPGKFADLVLLRKNPLENISHTMDIETVVLRGSVLDRVTLNRMLEQVQYDADHWPE